MSILSWDKPPRARSFESHASTYSADSTPPGVYVPNMSEDDRLKWKAKLVGTRTPPARVEIRKGMGNGVQILIVVGKQNPSLSGHSWARPGPCDVKISMNGSAEMSLEEFENMYTAVGEARERLKGMEE